LGGQNVRGGKPEKWYLLVGKYKKRRRKISAWGREAYSFSWREKSNELPHGGREKPRKKSFGGSWGELL